MASIAQSLGIGILCFGPRNWSALAQDLGGARGLQVCLAAGCFSDA